MTELISYVTNECTTVDTEERYDSMLNEIYSFKSVGGPFAHMEPARILKENDNVCYRTGKNDWEDSEGFVEIEGDSYESADVEAARDEFVSDLESEESDLEEEIEGLLEDEANTELVADKRKELEALKTKIGEARAYEF